MTPTTSKLRKSHKILIALAGLAVVVGLAFGLPNFVSDGTEKFSGIEAEIAREDIKDGYIPVNTDPLPELPAFKAHVKEVYRQHPEKKCGSAEMPGITYRIEVAKITFFGIMDGGYSKPICTYD